MKKIIILLLVFTALTAFAKKSVTLDFKSVKNAQKTAVDTAIKLVNELKPILSEPMSWCQVEPTGKFKSGEYKDDKKYSYLSIEVKVECNEKMAKELFKNTVYRYRSFLNNRHNGNLVDSIIADNYPHLLLMWGSARPHKYIYKIALHLKSEYGGFKGNQNKVVLFKMILNNNHTAKQLGRFRLHGDLLFYSEEGSKINRDIFSHTRWFTYYVLKTTLESGNPSIRLEPVYRPTKNAKYLDMEYR